MTRRLTIAKEFEQGTLVKVTPHAPFADNSTAHVYYVPERARLDAGMEKVHQTESMESFVTDEDGFDWEAIRNLVSAADIVERAEKRVLARTDGDIGDAREAGGHWGHSSSEQMTIPAGVVKFGDPDADHENAPVRDPLERGHLWATLKDWILTDVKTQQLQYHNDVQRTHVLQARVPIAVITEGQEAIVAYLAAHDHSNPFIGRAFSIDPAEVREILERVYSKDD